MLGLVLVSTIAYPNYAEAYSSGELYSLLIAVFPLWSIVSSYVGVRALFQVSEWKARVWFLVLPAGLYLAAIAALVAALVTIPQP